MRYISTVLVTILLASFMHTAYAQQQGKYSDEMLQTFAVIEQEIGPVRESVQKHMEQTVESNGLSMDRFQQMFMARRMGDASLSKATQKEKDSFDRSLKDMAAIQQNLMQKISDVTTQYDLTPMQYEEMLMAYQQNPEVKKRVDAFSAQQEKSDK